MVCALMFIVIVTDSQDVGKFFFFFFYKKIINKTKLTQKHSKEKTFIISHSLAMLTVESPTLFNQVYNISCYNADPVLTVSHALYFLHMHQCIRAETV